jgi:hypothetical protein
VCFELLHISYRTRKPNPSSIYAVDRILRQQKEARAAAESQMKENQNTVYPLHSSGVGLNQFPNSDARDIPPQPSQSTKLSIANTFQNLRRTMGSMASGRESMGLAPSPPQISPSSLETPEKSSAIERKTRTPPAISGISSPWKSSSSSSAVTPLGHICASIVIGCASIALDYHFYSEQH